MIKERGPVFRYGILILGLMLLLAGLTTVAVLTSDGMMPVEWAGVLVFLAAVLGAAGVLWLIQVNRDASLVATAPISSSEMRRREVANEVTQVLPVYARAHREGWDNDLASPLLRDLTERTGDIRQHL